MCADFKTLVKEWPEASIRLRFLPRKKGKTYNGCTKYYDYDAVPSKGKLSIKLKEFKASNITDLIALIKRYESYFVANGEAVKLHPDYANPSNPVFSPYQSQSLQPSWNVFLHMLLNNFESVKTWGYHNPFLTLKGFQAFFTEGLNSVRVSPTSKVYFSCNSDEEMFQILKEIHDLSSKDF